ncbi:hypothetical protein T09_8657, partial [Trichinella sp. T9]
MELFRYSNLLTEGQTMTVMCWNYTEREYRCNDRITAAIFPCKHDCDTRGNYAYCKFRMTPGISVECDAPYRDYLPVLVMLNSDIYCKSCDATKSGKLMFSYTYFHHYAPHLGFLTKHVSCDSLITCEGTYEFEDVPPVVYYEDGDFHPTSHCSILTKDI